MEMFKRKVDMGSDFSQRISILDIAANNVTNVLRDILNDKIYKASGFLDRRHTIIKIIEK